PPPFLKPQDGIPDFIKRLVGCDIFIRDRFGDTDGKRDAMLRFTKPVTGGY
ncbi:hypothetical protein ACVGWF_01990, partial [Enterobacter asburiae]